MLSFAFEGSSGPLLVSGSVLGASSISTISKAFRKEGATDFYFVVRESTESVSRSMFRRFLLTVTFGLMSNPWFLGFAVCSSNEAM